MPALASGLGSGGGLGMGSGRGDTLGWLRWLLRSNRPRLWVKSTGAGFELYLGYYEADGEQRKPAPPATFARLLSPEYAGAGAGAGIGNKVNLIELCLALPLAALLRLELLCFLSCACTFLFCCCWATLFALYKRKTKWKINFVCTLQKKAKGSRNFRECEGNFRKRRRGKSLDIDGTAMCLGPPSGERDEVVCERTEKLLPWVSREWA